MVDRLGEAEWFSMQRRVCASTPRERANTQAEHVGERARGLIPEPSAWQRR